METIVEAALPQLEATAKPDDVNVNLRAVVGLGMGLYWGAPGAILGV